MHDTGLVKSGAGTVRCITAAIPKLLQVIVICSFFVTIGLSILVPVFTDEVSWKFLQARYFIDGYVNITLFPQCGSPFTLATPWFMVPFRIAESWLYGDLSLLQLRVLGIVSFMAWMALVLVAVSRSQAFSLKGLPLLGIAASFLGLGTLPFLLAINRPEQILLIGLTLLLLGPFAVPDPRSRAADLTLGAGALIVVAALFAEHPKSLLFFPLIAVSLFDLVRRPLHRISAYAILGYLAAHSYAYWSARAGCPNDPDVAALFGTQMLKLSDFGSTPLTSLKQMALNALESFRYLGPLLMTGKVGSGWLLKFNTPDLLMRLATILVFVAFLCIVAVFAVSVVKQAAQAFRTRTLSRLQVMILAGLMSLGIVALLQIRKNFYEAGLVLPLFGLIVLMALPGKGGPRILQAGRFLQIGLPAVSVFSQAMLWSGMMSVPLSYYTQGGYLLPDQGMSVSPFKAGQIREEVLATAQMCRIDMAQRPKHLVVDDLTYPALAQSYQPFHAFYIIPGQFVRISREFGLDTDVPPSEVSSESREFLHLMSEWRSDGFVAGCQFLPRDLRSRALRNGAYCCLPGFGEPDLKGN